METCNPKLYVGNSAVHTTAADATFGYRQDLHADGCFFVIFLVVFVASSPFAPARCVFFDLLGKACVVTIDQLWHPMYALTLRIETTSINL